MQVLQPQHHPLPHTIPSCRGDPVALANPVIQHNNSAALTEPQFIALAPLSHTLWVTVLHSCHAQG